jgi:2,5-furandicarboxylate decarboxylase 1
MAAVSKQAGVGSELEIAGAFLGEPLRVVKAETVNLMVPADCEIIIEGIVPAKKRQYEGPFGEWPHYYYKEGEQPYIEVTAITMRKNPIYQCIHSAHFEHNIIGAAPRLGSLLRRIQEVVPSTTGVNMPISGAARSHCYISLKKRAEGEPKQAALGALVTDPNIKHVIVVDDDVDVFNETQVLWALAMRFQADRDLVIILNIIGSHLNPTAYGFNRMEKGPMETKDFLRHRRCRRTIPKEAQHPTKCSTRRPPATRGRMNRADDKAITGNTRKVPAVRCSNCSTAFGGFAV